MTARLVVGLFPSAGIALDAYHRLHTEGFPQNRIGHRVLKDTGPITPAVAAELEALQVDPMVLGDARRSFARFIGNGETAVFVAVEDDAEASAATEILSLFVPLAIDTLVGGAGSAPPAHG